MEHISWTIYDFKVCHKIFIMLVVEKENLPPQLQRDFFYAWDLQTSSSHIPATVGCNDLVPFIIPTSLVTQRRMQQLRRGTGATERHGSRLHTHLHNVLQRGELRWAAEMHHAILQLSYWHSHIILGLPLVVWGTAQAWINTWHYFFLSNKALESIYFSCSNLWFCRCALFF